jgi:hypothetical protein
MRDKEKRNLVLFTKKTKKKTTTRNALLNSGVFLESSFFFFFVLDNDAESYAMIWLRTSSTQTTYVPVSNKCLSFTL